MSVVKDLHLRQRRQPDPVGPAGFPDRPNSRILSDAIPLYFIARNKNGFWVVREAAGQCCGVFLFRRSALAFARKCSAPAGCATMLLTERFEPGADSKGNAVVVWLDAALRRALRIWPGHAHAAAVGTGSSQVLSHVLSNGKGARR